MLKRIAWIVSGLLVLGVGTFYAVGGYAGSLLLFVRYAVRTDAAPTREVSWKAGPEAIAAKAEKHEKTGKRKQPNVILIVADDLGFNDITLNGGGLAGGSVPTPHIDSIARQGVNFQTGYAGNATCAPSRAALMTGRYPTRFGFEFTPTPKQFMKIIGNEDRAGSIFKPVYHPERAADLIPYEDMGLPTSEITVARLLKESGYHTVHLGK